MALITPFAENGNRATIPATTSDGSVSYDQGFGSFYALPPEEGGLFIDRAQFNQLMYDTTSQVLTNKSNIATAKADITTLQGQVSNLEGDVSSIESTISQVVSSDVTPIGVYKNVENKTIGRNGDFKTIQEAFVYVQTHQRQGSNQGITLTLLEDLSGDLTVIGSWYPYLTIDCNGFVLANKLSISRSQLTILKLKSNDRVFIDNSIVWIRDSVNINYQSNDYPGGCITGYTASFIYVACGECNFSAPSNRSAFHCHGNSIMFVTGTGAITQRTGAYCFSVSSGGIIQAYGLKLTGVTVPKANIAANTITPSGIIFGNYTR